VHANQIGDTVPTKMARPATSDWLDGRFELRKRLGAGAEGTVWEAYDHDAGRVCAIKLLTHLTRAARHRLAGEFLRLARVDHPALVPVYELRQVAHPPRPASAFAPGTSYFTSERVLGRPPRAAWTELDGADRDELLLRIAEDVAGALGHLHRAGLLHCDVKPDNLLVQDDGATRLVDLGAGLALGASGAGPTATGGTPRYMSAAALAGHPSAASDLYSLGASLYEIAAGRPAFSGSSASELVRAITARDYRSAASLGATHDALASVIDGLLGGDFESAGALAAQLAIVRETLGAAPRPLAVPAAVLPPGPLGNQDAVDAVIAALDATAAGTGAASLELIGPPAAGQRVVFDVALRDHAVGAIDAGATVCGHPLGAADDPLAWLDRRVSSGSSAVAWALAARDVLRQRADDDGPFAVFFGEDTDDDARGAALRRVLATESGTGSFTAVFAAASPINPDRAVAVAALDATTTGELIRRMVGRPVAADWTRAVAAATGGLAELVAETVRAAAARDGVEHLERAPADLLCSPTDLTDTFVGRVARLAPRRAAPLEALAVLGASAPVSAVADTLSADGAETVAALLDLRDLGLAVVTEDRAALPSRQHARAIAAALPDARARALHRAALAWRRLHTPEPENLAPHLLATGPAADAAAACLEGAARLARRGQPGRAAELASEAVDRCSGHARTDALIAVSRYACAGAEYPRAIDAAERAARTRDARRRREANLCLARALQRSGDLERAEGTLARLRDSAAGNDDDDDSVTGTYARVLVARARYDEALAAAGSPADWPPSCGGQARATRLEAAGLARLYTGDAEGADDAFVELDRLDSGTWSAKARALRGMVAQARGDIASAADLYRQAEDLARERGEFHAAAVAAQNAGSALSERGRHSDALAAFDRAIVELRRLGADAELSWALYNRASALASLGELEAARRACEAAIEQTRRAGAPQIRIYAAVLASEIAGREGRLGDAQSAAAEADALARREGQPRDRLFAAIGLAEARARAGSPDAGAAFADVQIHGDDDAHRLALARARVALALGHPLGDTATDLEAAAAAWASRDAADLVWRAFVALARAAGARGDQDVAHVLAERAREAFSEILAAAPARYRDGLRRDPDAVALSGLASLATTRSDAQRPADDRGADADTGRLRRLLAVSRRLNSELRLEPLLDEVIDTVIELTGAERGFLLLRETAGGGSSQGEVLSTHVARNFEQSTLSDEERKVSRSIAERAARTGDVVLSVDAAFDERFDDAASVAALKLRSVLAVPLRQKAQVIGTIYADHRFRAGAFDDASVALVVELANVAGVAIHNARLREDNLRRQTEIARLNAELEREIERKDAELKTVRASLPPTDDVDLRYRNIVGRSAPMLQMLRLVDRAADSELPVVIAGESGSGKELVARALHDQGRRADRPFVAVNCGAVAESLLESELFGHVRGAFTGAERNRRGMFEVADGGTLFLDEIADTAPSMQAKLLRALQEGEIRRVGDEQTRPVDVRVVAASNKDLRALVADGSFREDLYYRLDVLHIDVPPLRDRIDDLPALAEAILCRLAGENPAPALDRAALARLAGHSWPGNVRELENELARASALADDVILAEHLSAALARIDPTAKAADGAGDDLRLKPRVEALERVLVDEAMARTNGNQTAAARLLGLSRYGLQKKLKRYGIAGMTGLD